MYLERINCNFKTKLRTKKVNLLYKLHTSQESLNENQHSFGKQARFSYGDGRKSMALFLFWNEFEGSCYDDDDDSHDRMIQSSEHGRIRRGRVY